jgi:hypothetical protein
LKFIKSFDYFERNIKTISTSIFFDLESKTFSPPRFVNKIKYFSSANDACIAVVILQIQNFLKYFADFFTPGANALKLLRLQFTNVPES